MPERYVHGRGFLLHGPGDAIARISHSFMVALHALLSCVMWVASCDVILGSPPLSCIIVNPHFIGSFHLFGSMKIAVACDLGLSFNLHPGEVSKIAQSLVLYSVGL